MTPARETAAVRAARKALAATVRLASIVNPGEPVSHGSGVVVHAGGYIVTANHIVATARRVRVTTSDGTAFDAQVVAHDADNDFALLHGDAGKPLSAIVWGRSANTAAAETVLALGNSFGRGTVVTQGIVSALDATMELPGGDKFTGLLQTDASLHVGMSGGPLVNLDGELIGINLFVRGDEFDIAYALPTDRAKDRVAEWLRKAAASGK